MTIDEVIAIHEQEIETLESIIEKTKEYMNSHGSNYRWVFLELMDIILYQERKDALECSLRKLKALKEEQENE